MWRWDNELAFVRNKINCPISRVARAAAFLHDIDDWYGSLALQCSWLYEEGRDVGNVAVAMCSCLPRCNGP